MSDPVLSRGPLERVRASVPWRAWQRYSQVRGGVLAGGTAYAAFFSLFPLLAIGFTVVGLVLGDDAERQHELVNAVNESVGTPVLAFRAGDPGLLTVDQLTSGSTLSLAGLAGLVLLLFTGLGWVGAIREGVRAMFGLASVGGNPVRVWARDIGVLITMGLLVLASAVVGVAVPAAADAVLHWAGIDGSLWARLLLSVLDTLVVLGVDVTVLLVLFGALSGVQVSRADLWEGALAGGIALGLLKIFGGFLLARASGNRFLAAFAVIVGLLVWLNLISRVALLSAAWAAVTAQDRGHLPPLPLPLPSQSHSQFPERAGSPAVRVPSERAPVRRRPVGARPSGARPAGVRPAHPVRQHFQPVVSPRAADRVSVAAGAVIGAAGAVSAQAALRGVRGLWRLAVHRPRPDAD